MTEKRVAKAREVVDGLAAAISAASELLEKALPSIGELDALCFVPEHLSEQERMDNAMQLISDGHARATRVQRALEQTSGRLLEARAHLAIARVQLKEGT